jgi:hypothetical protein
MGSSGVSHMTRPVSLPCRPAAERRLVIGPCALRQLRYGEMLTLRT